jgi:glycosyltransferase involved in cell wall biosynthesis
MGPLMEIVQIAGLYPPHLGGEEAVVEHLAERQADGHRVTVYTSMVGAANAPAVEQRAGRAGRLRVVRQRAARIANTPVIPGLLLRLLLHRPKPDILHVHTGHALIPEMVSLAARLRRLPYIAHQHLMVRPSSAVGRVLLPIYYRLLYAPFLRRAERVICLTNAMRAELITTFDVDPDRVVVVPNGVDRHRFRQHTVSRSDAELLFVGRLTPQKNVDALLEAVAKLRDVGQKPMVRIVGEGEERDRLQLKAAGLLLSNVVFEGRRTSSEVADDYACATAVVLPSTHEGMPLVLLEAMAAGAPVVASNLPEIAEAGGDAILTVDPLTPGTLAEALGRVLDDPRLRDRLSEAGRTRAGLYTWEAVIATIDRMYTEVSGS